MSNPGPSSSLATDMLKLFTNNSPGSYSAWYAQLHTGEPGSAGTANVSSVTTRESISWNAPSGGSVTSSNTQTWSSWAGSADTLSYVSIWSASSSGTFYDSIALSSSPTMASGDTIEITEITITFTIAA
jgi:hypothetical protein